MIGKAKAMDVNRKKQQRANRSPYFFYGVFLSVMSSFLCGCSHPPCEQYLKHGPLIKPELLVKQPKPLPVLQRREYDLCLLRTHGVQVIRLGQTWKFILPSDALFNNETAEIQSSYKPILNIIADFMKTYSKISVEVAGYSDEPVEVFKTKFGTYTDE